MTRWCALLALTHCVHKITVVLFFLFVSQRRHVVIGVHCDYLDAPASHDLNDFECLDADDSLVSLECADMRQKG